jgi:TolB-like protein
LAVILAVLAALNVGGLRDWMTGASESRPIESIAVLPLENLSGDPEQEYFADGMTEALIANLAKIGALRVISRQSVMQFKGAATPLPEIARTLNVDALVEGSVLRSGDRVRITTQLVQATPERHLWAESYERDLDNVLVLQTEVARAIATQIQVAVSPEEAQQLAPSPRVNPEAYRLYLQGNYNLDRLTPETTQNAQSYFQQAIQADPEHAPSHAGLAAALTELGGWNSFLPPRAVHVPAKAAAQKALDLDSTLADGHIALARIKWLFEWDWAGAEMAFKQGIQLGPSSTTARIVYASYLTAVGRFEESIRIGTHTIEIDPLLPRAYQELGFAFHCAGRDGEALAMYRKTLELDPNMRGSRSLRALLYLKKGMIAESILDVDKYTKLVSYAGLPYGMGVLGYLYGKTGRQAEALSALSELRKRATTDYVPANAIGLVYLGLGRPEDVLGELERALAQREVFLVWLKVHPLYDEIRGHPRFQDLVRRMNFPE